MKSLLYLIKENILTVALVVLSVQGAIQLVTEASGFFQTAVIGVLTFYVGLLMPGEVCIKWVASYLDELGADDD